jgi:Xaa-Pro dipeptidase
MPPEDSIPKELFLINREKVLSFFPKEDAIILLKGGSSISKYNTDREYVFEQESNFRYLFGINYPDCYGLIDLNTRKITLFVPQKLNTIQHKYVNGDHFSKIVYLKNKFNIDSLLYNSTLDFSIKNKIKKIYVLDPNVIEETNAHVDTVKLKKVLTDCRVIKSPYELEILRKVNLIGCDAHSEIQKLIHPGLVESQLESLFNHHIYFYGNCRNPAYMGICASGTNASILHYVDNTKVMKSGELVLIDMGADYCGYISDITQTIPVNRKFTPKQKILYSIILNILNNILDIIKPGMLWTDIAHQCNVLLTQKLLMLGLVHGPMDELLKNKIYYDFMPHRLAHFIGLDVHDVGDLYTEYNLLKPGMTLAVEPGIYFNYDIMNKLKRSIHAKFIDFNKVAEYADIGGIRIECNIIVTNNGIENMTMLNRNFGY